jgi:hypothetical protein
VTRRALFRAVAVLCFALSAAPATAQPRDRDAEPAFSLASNHIFSTREQPSFTLTFRRISYLDFRVYRVRDPLDFFAHLRDPHVLGSERPLVPEERTWLERLAAWKSDMRDRITSFLRGQFSWEYRRTRREAAEKQQIQLRRTLRYHTFTQAPLLNPSQLVSSWREILPPVHAAEMRRVPLDIREPGAYVVEAVNGPLKAYTIVLISDLGIVTKSAPGQMLLYVANRFTGEPIPACDIRTIADRRVVATGVTGPDGTYETALAAKNPDAVVAVARCGNRVAVAGPGTWFLHGDVRELVAYLYTDRPVYRPGHTVNIKGVLRWRVRGALAPFDAKQAELSISDRNEKVLFRQMLPSDEFGAVHAAFVVPPGGALGYYSIRLAVGDQTAYGSFEVQQYRKPEFDVAVRSAQPFVIQGGRAAFSVAARYYFGQPVAGATVKLVVRHQPYYSPLRWEDEGEGDEESAGWYGGEEQSEQTTRLGPDGTATIPVSLPVDEDGRDYSMDLEARVSDASGREVSGHSVVHATYASFLIVVRPAQYIAEPGVPTRVDVRALDYVGQPQADLKLNVWVERITYRPEAGRREPAEQVAQSEITTGADGHASWEVTLPRTAGSYRVRALALAPDGRHVQAEAYLWVPGSTHEVEQETYVELVPDKKTYQPGDIARLMVRGADFEVPILVTKETDGVTFRRVVRYKPGDTLEVPIVDDDAGDTYVSVAFLKDDRFYRAEKRLRIPATSRQLQVSIVPDASVSRPGQTGRFTLAVLDASGHPVRAQLSVGVVDEALYGVEPDRTPDPLRFFYRCEYSRVGTEFSRGYSFVGFSGTQQLLLAQRHRPMTLADFKADRPSRPEVRKNFPDAIFWNASLVTDASGAAHVELPYPDSLTTWRMTVRAVTTNTLVGAAIGRTMTTKDLIVRVITPRFLTEGDETEVPIVVHNYLPSQKDVAIETTVSGLTPLAATGGVQHLSISSGGEQRLDPRFKADKVGAVLVTANATTEGASDGVEMSLPVLPFGLKRVLSASGSIVTAPEAAASLTIPDRSNPAARTLRISLAPSMAGALLGALDFLTSYPYGCTEQTLSSFVPNLVVLRALAQLKLAPTERLAALDRQVTEGLSRLYDYQHEDGGWGWWKTDENDPFMTAYALEGLLDAKKAGYQVEEERIYRGRAALERLYANYPRAIPDLKAYEAYVLERVARSREDDSDVRQSVAAKDRLEELWNARSRMSNYGRALLLLALQTAGDSRRATLEKELLSSVQVKGDLAWWPAESDPLLFEPVDASVEATSLAVRALVADHPKDQVLEQAVRWLLVNRNGGYYWSSTKQTAVVLYGLLDYMRARGEQAAPFTVDVFVNDALVGTRSFTEADLTSPNPLVLTAPAVAGANRIRLVKRGAGTLYWSAEAQYFQTGGPLAATGSRKLAISRLYFRLAPVQQNDRIVYRETAFVGTAQPGDVLLVRVTVAGSTDWRHLMIEDPLPAGAEPIKQQWLYRLENPVRWAPAAREYRDDRVVFFQQDFDEGRYAYVYLLKVVTPGVFKAMPAQIAPMYVPGVSASTEAQGVRFGALPPGRASGSQ